MAQAAQGGLEDPATGDRTAAAGTGRGAGDDLQGIYARDPGAGAVPVGREGQGSALDPLGPAAPDPHPMVD